VPTRARTTADAIIRRMVRCSLNGKDERYLEKTMVVGRVAPAPVAGAAGSGRSAAVTYGCNTVMV
jgi:hypothetical protein